MPHTSYTEDLELRLVKAQRQYEVLKAAAHTVVTHWLITSNERYSLRLHYFERERWRRGEILTNVPYNGTYYRYGLMPDERIAVEECYKNGTLIHETFWQHTATMTQTIRYVSQRANFISQLDYADGLPILYRHYGYQRELQRTREIYTHVDERLTTIKVDDIARNRWLIEYQCFYTPERKLERIDWVTTLPTQMNNIYLAPIARNRSLPDVKRQALVEAIVAAVAKKNIDRPVCALMLNYIYLEALQPMVVPLFEDDRRDYLAENPADVQGIWNAEDVSPTGGMYIELRASYDLWVDAAREFGLEGDIIDADDDLGRKLLADIAHDLHAVDWTGKLNITDDFVAFSLDYEGDSVQERLAASVPQEKLDLLRARGLW